MSPYCGPATAHLTYLGHWANQPVWMCEAGGTALEAVSLRSLADLLTPQPSSLWGARHAIVALAAHAPFLRAAAERRRNCPLPSCVASALAAAPVFTRVYLPVSLAWSAVAMSCYWPVTTVTRRAGIRCWQVSSKPVKVLKRHLRGKYLKRWALVSSRSATGPANPGLTPAS